MLYSRPRTLFPPLFFDRDHREELFEGYERLVAALELIGIGAEQWIGGSFVSKTPHPEDIDLVNYCDAKAFQDLTPETKAMIARYFRGRKTAEHCHCDSYFVPSPPAGHAHSEDFKVVLAYWQKKLGHDKIGRPKGIVSRVVQAESESNDLEEKSDAVVT